MSYTHHNTAFNKFLGNDGKGTFFKSYSHATELYVSDNYARAPKLGFLYFVSFNINPTALANSYWPKNGQQDVGLLVKKVDQPKFKIATETINQYNRKTNVQTKITYEPISIEFHDDNSEITNNLWINYYKYYYEDSNYNKDGVAFSDTKFNIDNFRYGLDNGQTVPFFDSVDIFVLHQGKFTQMTIKNPLITQWDHDSLNQSEGTKILQNKMTLAYESVYYSTGEIVPGSTPNGFAARYYDNVHSPLRVGTELNPNGTSVGPNDVYGKAKIAENISAIPPNSGPSLSQLDKAQAQQIPRYGAPAPMAAGTNGVPLIPVYGAPNPIGAGTVGLGYQPPSGFRIFGLNLWYGHGGIHGKVNVAAGPINLVLKK
jgi:hypothetical protein